MDKKQQEKFLEIKELIKKGDIKDEDKITDYLDNTFFGLAFDKYKEIVDDENIIEEPSIENGTGGDFFYQTDEDGEIITEASIDYEDEIAQMKTVIEESKTLDDAVLSFAEWLDENIYFIDYDDED